MNWYLIYGTFVIMINDFTRWIIKGFIAHEKGYEMNWSITTTWTTKDKGHKVEAIHKLYGFVGSKMNAKKISCKLR